MAMYCQRVINEALFEAQMGSLNRTSRVITEPLYLIPPQQLTDQPTTSHFSTVESSAGQFFFTLSGVIFQLSEIYSN